MGPLPQMMGSGMSAINSFSITELPPDDEALRGPVRAFLLNAMRSISGSESYWHDVAGTELVDDHEGPALDKLRDLMAMTGRNSK